MDRRVRPVHTGDLAPAPIALPFRFDAAAHEYTALDTGEELPHITGMLEQCGYTHPEFYTLDSQFRGSAVHRLTADWDLKAITDLSTVTSAYSGWLQAYAGQNGFVPREKPTMITVEEPCVHAYYRYGGRPDRVVRLYGLLAVLEIKSGLEEDAHCIQTALQAMLAAQEHGDGMPAEMWGRFAVYLRPNGRFFLEQHSNNRDFDTAREVIRECCGR